MANVTIMINDQYGGYVKCTRELITGLLFVVIFNGHTEESHELCLDPKEPEVISWLQRVFPAAHLDTLDLDC
jgi:hypothetical protein